MHQNAFGGRALPGPAGRAYSSPPDPLAGLGVEARGRERRGNRAGKKERGGPPNV